MDEDKTSKVERQTNHINPNADFFDDIEHKSIEFRST